MLRNTKLMVALVALAVLIAPVASAMAQETKVTEEATILVMKVIGGGQTVIIKNLKTNEIKKFTNIPANVSLMVNGKPAKLSDLREGMHLQGIRMENVSESTISEAEVSALPASSPAPAPAPAPAAAPAPAPAAAAAPAEAPAELPKTASNLPLLGFVGLSFLLAGLALRTSRRSS